MMSSNFVLLPLCSLKHTVTLNLYGNVSWSSIFFLLSSGGTAADDGWHGGSDHGGGPDGWHGGSDPSRLYRARHPRKTNNIYVRIFLIYILRYKSEN